MNNFEIKSDFTQFKKKFLEINSRLNLISKNDEKFLYEKHIYDSLSIDLFFKKCSINTNGIKLLDIGCGGGFPCVPIAIEHPEISVTGIDSIRKKVNAVNEIKNSLSINNLELICDRAENIKDKKYNIITSRAVADLNKICEYALPLLYKDGYFIAYKSKKAAEEIHNAEKTLSKYKAKIKAEIQYTLPLNETYERNLIIISF